MTNATAIPSHWTHEFERSATVWSDVADLPPSGWDAAFELYRKEQEHLVSRGRWRSGPASTLGILGRRHLEVDHSRMLAWLLDPRGHHGLGARFLRAFRALAGCSNEVDGLEHVVIVREEACYVDGVLGLVDIVVRGPGWCMVIENKIWSDQHGWQLDHYYDAFADESPDFVFLTPAGLRARSRRPEVCAEWRPLSWRRQVVPTLREMTADLRSEERRPLGLPAVEDYLRALEEEL